MRATIGLIAVTVLLVGCGGGDDDGGSSTTGGGAAGGGGEPAAAAPKQQFASLGCASCHTLAAADATGKTGPNLDELKPSVDAAVEQITNGGGGMPAFGDRLSDKEIRSLAEFVSTSAGG